MALCPGLTYQNAAKSLPKADETLKKHMVQVFQGIRSTNPKPQIINCKLTEATSLPSNTTPSHELHIKVEHISKIYTYDTGHFLVRSWNINQYIIIVYHFDSNTIIYTPFKSCSDKLRLFVYVSIMQRLKDRNMLADLQILDN